MAGVRKSLQKVRQNRHVGRYVLDEMTARNWSARRLAIAMDRPVASVRALLGGSIVTSRDAAGLASAFGTSPELWMELETECREDEIRQRTY
jgi:HTH-type transcriptional regulator / antitoxin HigA